MVKTNKLVILRGLPGSGKSTYVKKIFEEELARGGFPVICSADDIFTGADGVYRYDRDKLPRAHMMCQAKCKNYMRRRASLIIIDNTNIKRNDYKKYVDIVLSDGYYSYKIIEFGCKNLDEAKVFHERCVHGVDWDVCVTMYNNWQHNSFATVM